VIAVLMAFLLLTEEDPRRALQSVFRRTFYVLVPFSLLLIKYFPQYGVLYSRWSGSQTWIGVTLQKNGLGRLCLCAAFFLVWTLVRRWRGRDVPADPRQTPMEAIVLVMTVWLLVGGVEGQYSATAIAALAVGLALFATLLWLRERGIDPEPGTLTTGIALLILFGTATVFIGGSTLAAFTSALGRDATLTGRTDVWAQLLPVVLQHPFGGSGFGSFWTPGAREFYQISEGHSGYLDVLLDMGFVGLLLISVFLLFSCRDAQRELDGDPDWAILWICFLVMTVVHNITETSMNSLTSLLMAILLFLAVAVPGNDGSSPHDEPHGGTGSLPPIPSSARRSITAD
jgi:O-antigen ligase